MVKYNGVAKAGMAFFVLATVLLSGLAYGLPHSKSKKTAAAPKPTFETRPDKSPALSDFINRLRVLKQEQTNIVEQYKQKAINRDEAKAMLVPLADEEKKILDDPTYRVELRLREIDLRTGREPASDVKARK